MKKCLGKFKINNILIYATITFIAYMLPVMTPIKLIKRKKIVKNVLIIFNFVFYLFCDLTIKKTTIFNNNYNHI